MDDDNERAKIVQHIKKYYSKYKKTPSMKEIELKCKINPRVFYKLFRSQKEAFNLAGVPYSDDARKKVEKANIARKDEIKEKSENPPSRVLYVVSKRNFVEKDEKKYFDKISYMTKKLNDIKAYYRLIKPNDNDLINIAFEQVSNFIYNWNIYLKFESEQYEDVKSIKNSDNPSKYMLHILGYDSYDLKGSYDKKLEKKFNDMVSSTESLLWDMKAKEFFKKKF